MNHPVFACVDALANSTAVVDWAVWAAERLPAPLTFLHMLERHPERASVSDHSGSIGLGAQESLLKELAELDARQGVLAQRAGRALLAAVHERAVTAGVAAVDTRLRHGAWVDGVLELEAEARLFVLGQHARPRDAGRGVRGGRLQLDHHIESVVRAVTRPVLVATGDAFARPQRFVIAFDGSSAARKTVQTVLTSPLLAGLPVLLAMANGSDGKPASAAIDDARAALTAAGFDATTEHLHGEPEAVLPALVRAQGAALLVMGAYGHSRIRQWIVGSTTTMLLRGADVPLLILR